jgi:hypothetical protein
MESALPLGDIITQSLPGGAANAAAQDLSNTEVRNGSRF